MLLRACLRRVVWVAIVVALVVVVAVYTSRDDSHHQFNTHRNQKTRNNLRRWLSWSDPKTIVEKPTTTPRTSHLTNEDNDRNNDNNDGLDVSKLRIVAFGTSKTWGAGLKHPDRETYVSLLSPTAVNLGLRSTPADYPSLCLHSMIGNQIFDVIILEFSPFGGVPHHDFERLAHKLRARFPKAIMIYLPIYMLLFDVTDRNKDTHQQEGLQAYLQSLLEFPQKPVLETTIRGLDEADLTFPCESYNLDVYRTSLHALDGYLVEFPTFANHDVKSFVLHHAQYYGSEERPWDFVHPNALGHQVIAQRLRQLLYHIHATRPILSQQQQEQEQHTADDTTVLGTWLGGKDRCISWFSGGNVPEGVLHYTNMELVNFTPDGADGKWALEVNRAAGGTLSVECAFFNCTIYLSYMAKGPEPEYPKVIVSLANADPRQQPQQEEQQHQQEVPSAILVNPNIDNFHVRQIVQVGTVVSPGTVTLSIRPIPEDDNALHRFRITGVITTSTAD